MAVGIRAAVPPAPPPLPSSFYGALTADNETLTPGITISAQINQTPYAQTTIFEHEGQWVYTLKVPADNPATEEVEGGRPGDTITFIIQDKVVATAPWLGGTNSQLDLTVESVVKAQAGASRPSGIWIVIGIVILLILAAAVIRYRSIIIAFLRSRSPNE